MTGEEWSKEPEEVKETIKKLHEEQRVLSMAIKKRRTDDINLTAKQKSAYMFVSIKMGEISYHSIVSSRLWELSLTKFLG